jgi:hypothetical protein
MASHQNRRAVHQGLASTVMDIREAVIHLG